MKAIRIRKYGGKEVLDYVDVERPDCKSHEVLVKLEALGVNFIDTYQRSGLYPVSLPFIPGLEGAGTVERIGSQVTQFKPGDRVAFADVPGAYAEFVCASESRLVRIPDALSLENAAATMLQGMTAHYLTQSTFPLKAHHTCLIHAAAGGVGLLAIQLAKASGAYVIGTVSTEAKAELARQAGADALVLYSRQDFEQEVMKITEGQKVDVVYDSVGKDTFEKSLNCLKPRGMMVTFGQSSGPITAFSPLMLSQRGSLYLTRTTLKDYIADRPSLETRSQDLFHRILAGKLHLRIEHKYSLKDARQAHSDLEGRKTTGKILMFP
ncbi:MAG: quinone oxidoreductase [SAR324 cluster bacterium]|nr:quinone oxidoreductase [SAR324 cluster bacterium]